MPLLSAFHCLFKGITANTNSLTGRSAFFHSSGLFSKLFVGAEKQMKLRAETEVFLLPNSSAVENAEDFYIRHVGGAYLNGTGLSVCTNEKVLRDAFSLYGRILQVSVIVDHDSGQSKGFGFVQFASEMEADNALGKMDGRSLDGRNIHVDIACIRLRYRYDGDLPRAVGPPPGVKPQKLINTAIYTRRRIKRSQV